MDDALYRAQYADFHTYLPDQILAKVDRASMAVSLEVRVPLLDHRFVGRFAPLPPDEKVRARRGKHALREALRRRLPASILDGTKRGFDTPLRAWIRGPLAGPVREALASLPAEWFDRFVEPVPAALAGRTLADSGIASKTGLNVVAVQKADGPALNPGADTRLDPSQELVMLGTAEQRNAFRESFS